MSGSHLAAPSSQLLADSAQVHRLLFRLARELQERHPDPARVTLCGIVTRGVFLADRLRRLIAEQGGGTWEGVSLDVGPYRDDRVRPALATPSGELVAFPLPAATADGVRDRVVVLVDDVFYHGRTARAALVALAELARPRAVELLVLVDRGHRELPLRATYVGKNIPTAQNERVAVRVADFDPQDAILLDRIVGSPA